MLLRGEEWSIEIEHLELSLGTEYSGAPKIELTQQTVVMVVSQQFHHGSGAVTALERHRGLVLNSTLALRL